MVNKELLETFNRYLQILNDRYNDCADSHQKPDVDSVCNHCYRHPVYETPQTNSILNARKGIPLLHQPLDAPWLADKRRQEMGMQETADWISGIDKIRKELEKSV